MPAIEQKQTRSLRFERGAVDEKARTVTLSFSSETPVDRYFGREVLSHKRGAADLSRLEGGPLLWVHDPSQHIGRIESAWIDDAAKKGRAIVRFGRSPLAEEKFRDVLDGILDTVSVGYKLGEDFDKKQGQDGSTTFTFRRWKPYEITMTPLPADTAVGVGRAKTETRITMPASTEIENTNTERQRCAEIAALGKRHNCAEEAQEAIADGRSVEEFQAWMRRNCYNAKPINTPDEFDVRANIGMSQREIHRYSICRAIRQAAEGKLDGLEKEASDATAKICRRNSEGGFFIPHDVAAAPGSRAFQARAALNATTGTAGGFTVGTDLLSGSMIELLRNKPIASKLGVRTLSGLVGNVAIPRVTGGAASYWLSEGGTVTNSEQTFGQVGMSPHRLAAVTAFNRQLVAQSSIDIESFVRDDLMTVLAIEKDRAFFAGSGASGEPLGLMNWTGLSSITYGGPPTWAKVLENSEILETANVTLEGSMAFLVSPAVKKKWKSTVKVTNQALFLIGENGLADGHRVFSTNQLPAGDQTIFADWSQACMADWAGIEVVVDPYTRKRQGEVEVQITLMTDNALRHVPAFVLSTDSGAQ